MQRTARLVAAAATLAVFASTAPSGGLHARERQRLDADWRFFLGDDPAASEADFADNSWRSVHLPHDWSIEGAPKADAPSGGAGGYLPTGVGWYRRTFDALDAWRGKRVRIEFDGVYHRAEVWLNGERLGRHAYGYTPFGFDLAPHLKFGQPNVLSVRVDNSQQPNCRWYSGSGIYRHVWLEVASELYLNRDKLFARTTEATADSATLMVDYELVNQSAIDIPTTVEIVLIDKAGEVVASEQTELGTISGASAVESVMLFVPRPRLWSPDSPELYRIAMRVKEEGQLEDELTVPIGIRTVHVSPERGFELNGQTVKLYGGCVHHDNGPLGAAAFDAAEWRKVRLLKEAGFNAVRTAHNPPSPAFLDACDRLGLLVVDEAFDGWAKKKIDHDYHLDFAENWQADLETFIRRDRNHPSVVMWSIGNEMFERAEESGGQIAAEMAAVVRALDATRPITLACNRAGDDEAWRRVDATFAPVDVAGYNYQLDVIDADHRRLPERVIMSTESFPKQAFHAWGMIDERPYLIGDFVWTAMDYLGEAGLGRVFRQGETARDPWVGPPQFPAHGASCGDIDLTGWRKPISHYRNILWDRGEKLYVAVITPVQGSVGRWGVRQLEPHWTWPGMEGQQVLVETNSRDDAVRLYQDGELVSEHPDRPGQAFKAHFLATYKPGELRAVGVDDGKEVEELTLTTAGDAAAIRLTPDRTRIAADGQDLSFVTVEVVDSEGRWRPDAAVPVEYVIAGQATIAGVGSGDLSTRESYQANPRKTYQGRSLVVIRAADAAGEITLTAKAPGLESHSITITAESPP